MAQVQFNYATNFTAGGASNTGQVTCSATGAGNFYLVYFAWKTAQGVSLTNVTDNQSQTLQQLNAPIVQGGTTINGYYMQNTAAGVTAVNFKLSSTTTSIYGIWIAEESGIVTSGSPFDTTAQPTGQNQAAVTSFTSGAMTSSTQANLVLYGWSFSGTSTNVSYAATGTLSQLGTHQNIPTDGDDTMLMRGQVSATGSYAATGTCTSATCATMVAALKIAGGSTIPASASQLEGGLTGGFWRQMNSFYSRMGAWGRAPGRRLITLGAT